MTTFYIKDSIHFEPLEERREQDLKVGDHVYIAFLPYAITTGFTVTHMVKDTCILDGRPMSASSPALYKDRNEAIDCMIRQLEKLKVVE